MKKELYEAYLRGDSSNFVESEESYRRRKYSSLSILIIIGIFIFLMLIFYFSDDNSGLIGLFAFFFIRSFTRSEFSSFSTAVIKTECILLELTA